MDIPPRYVGQLRCYYYHRRRVSKCILLSRCLPTGIYLPTIRTNNVSLQVNHRVYMPKSIHSHPPTHHIPKPSTTLYLRATPKSMTGAGGCTDIMLAVFTRHQRCSLTFNDSRTERDGVCGQLVVIDRSVGDECVDLTSYTGRHSGCCLLA
jgi:hypothetical protein